MIPRSPEAEALSALLRRNEDRRTPAVADRTPDRKTNKDRLWQEAKRRAAQKRSRTQQRSDV